MGQVDGFLKFKRELPTSKDPEARVGDYKEIYKPFPAAKTREQAARCMDCGVPFCHSGCPLGNIIPEFNDAVYNQQWALAAEILHSTNNFPEFTGRICPAPCEASCVLGINKPPVAIEHIEKSIIEKAYELNLVGPEIPEFRTGKKVAVIGSGPAGLAAAAQLNKAGHWVTVFERDDRIGGLLRYGIPDFKLEKWVIDRRMKIMDEEGIRFKVNAEIGVNVNPAELLDDFDAIVLCTGATAPRDLPIDGRELKGIHFAMDFLKQQNKRVAGDEEPESPIWATDQNVVVIGGGDTGSDCIGTSHRHGAASVTQLELLPKPPLNRSNENPWPQWPVILRTSSSHEEGGDREWSILTKSFVDDGKGNVKGLKVADIAWNTNEEGKRIFSEVEGSERVIPCDLALLAIGFVSPEESLPKQLKLELDARGNIKTKKYRSVSNPKVYSAGDARRGQSLVVWAIAEGREAAAEVDKALSGETALERRDRSYLSL